MLPWAEVSYQFVTPLIQEILETLSSSQGGLAQ